MLPALGTVESGTEAGRELDLLLPSFQLDMMRSALWVGWVLVGPRDARPKVAGERGSGEVAGERWVGRTGEVRSTSMRAERGVRARQCGRDSGMNPHVTFPSSSVRER